MFKEYFKLICDWGYFFCLEKYFESQPNPSTYCQILASTCDIPSYIMNLCATHIRLLLIVSLLAHLCGFPRYFDLLTYVKLQLDVTLDAVQMAVCIDNLFLAHTSLDLRYMTLHDIKYETPTKHKKCRLSIY